MLETDSCLRQVVNAQLIADIFVLGLTPLKKNKK